MTKQDNSDQQQASSEAAAVSLTDAPKKLSKRARTLLIAGGIIIALLLVVYGVGAAFFSSHFYPNTKFNSQDISFQADSDFVSDVEAQVPSYALSITGNGYSQTITADQVDLTVDEQQLREDAFAGQNIWLWPVEVFFNHDVSDAIHANFNGEKVTSLLSPVAEEYNKTATPCEDATIVYDEASSSVVVKDEVYGTQLDIEEFEETVEACLESMIDEYEIESSVCIQPTILSSDSRFADALATAKQIVGGEIELTMADGAVSAGKITKDLLASWLTLDPETFAPTLNQEAVSAWANEKSSELNTVGTKRTFSRPDGKSVTVSGGVYGWTVNVDDLASTVIGNVTAGNFAAIDIPCSQTADVYNGPGGRDWGAYIDIDISEQKVRYISANNEQLFITDCVTGSVAGGHDTPTGLYYLRAKKSPETLIGYNSDGSISYQSDVTYWMPFIRNSIGLHDASWRSTFGGSIYKTNGSHGCVNLPTSAAKWFYDNVTTNTAVLVHG